MPLNGTYLTIVLEVEPGTAHGLFPNKAVVLSTLFPHESKLSVMHFKVKRTLENKDIVPSK